MAVWVGADFLGLGHGHVWHREDQVVIDEGSVEAAVGCRACCAGLRVAAAVVDELLGGAGEAAFEGVRLTAGQRTL